MSRPFASRNPNSGNSFVRINGKIRAREVRVIGNDGSQLGIISLSDALTMARTQGVDLVEIAPNATPPVCRLVDYGKFRYEQAKKDKESKKRQHATKVKEVQLSPSIDPHDFQVKLTHATDFLCEEMKVKVTLRFRGREMAHKEFGFERVKNFTQALAPFGHPDSDPKLVGRGIIVMMSPLPRNKRARNPKQLEGPPTDQAEARETNSVPANNNASPKRHYAPAEDSRQAESNGGFANNPFAGLDVSVSQ